MMAFTTRCCRKLEARVRGGPRRQPLLRALITLLVGVVLLFSAAVRAEGIQVKSATVEPVEDAYYLNASFDISLNGTLEQALNKGVALYFLVEFELIRPRWYWFDEKIAQTELQLKLSYNALTRQYRLSAGSLYQNFDSLDEAVQVLSRLRNRQVFDRAALKKDNSYIAALRMRLDVSLLPKPFQVDAIASREWNIGSDWYRWTVTAATAKASSDQKAAAGDKP